MHYIVSIYYQDIACFMKRIQLLLLLLCLSAIAHAQLGLGLEVGCNLSNLQVQSPMGPVKDRTGLGFRGGLIVLIGANKDFCLTTGLYYSTKGSNVSTISYYGATANSHIILRSLELPFYITMQTKQGPIGRLAL